jgi:hypothetical protein
MKKHIINTSSYLRGGPQATFKGSTFFLIKKNNNRGGSDRGGRTTPILPGVVRPPLDQLYGAKGVVRPPLLLLFFFFKKKIINF